MKMLAAIALCSTLLCAQDPTPAPAPAPKPVGEKPATDKPQGGKPQGGKPQSDTPKTEKPASEKPASDAGKPKDAQGKTDVPKTDGSKEPKIDKPASDQPQPRGADPADLRAIQSAQAMIEAEKKLAEQIKAGKIPGLDKIVTFDEVSSWPYEDGLKGMPKRCKELDGKKVMMTGFMLPIDEVQNIKEFLLVQSLWSCCYGQPPDINGIVRVVMPKGKTTDYFFDPLKIVGTFKVEATVIEGYCVDIYQLHVDSIEAIK